MIKKRYVWASIAGVLLLALFLVGAAVGRGARVGALSRENVIGNASSSYSGDDIYDPAAGGDPERSLVIVSGGFSGDDAYDPAAGGNPVHPVVIVSGGYSGDDAYDPAAGGDPR